MRNVLNVVQGVKYDDSITKLEYHSYSPFLNSFNNGDEIRISIQHQDLFLLISESFIYIEGRLLKDDDNTVSATATLTNNAIAYLLESIRYEMNGVEIDQNKNVGHTSLLKNYVSLTANESKKLINAAWSPENAIVLEGGYFNFCVPLKMLLGFAEDYKKIILNAKHEIILTRTRTDSNAIISAVDNVSFHISKLQWKVPHVTAADSQKLALLKVIESGKPITMSFRSWDLYEYPLLSASSNHTWAVKTTNQLEKPRYIILALQSDRKNKKDKDYSKFDNCELVDVKLHLNSESFPYDDMNLSFATNRYALLYDMYSNFQQSYYGRESNPLLNPSDFGKNVPIVLIDCSHQNEAVKSGPVDIRLEFKTANPIPPQTSAYCLLIHDRIVDYNPLTNEIKKHV